MSTGVFCGVGPLLFRKKVSGFKGKSKSKTSKHGNKASKNVGNVKASKVQSSGNLETMTELRKKISTLRDLLDFSPCVGSASVNELLILTLNDLFQRYTKIKPVVEFKGASLHKALEILCDALKSLGDLWTTEKWMVGCEYNSSMEIGHVELAQRALAILDDIIKVTRERLFEEEDDDDEDMAEYSPSSSAFGKALSEAYSDNRTSFSSSPETPTSVLSGSWKSLSARERASCSSPLLVPIRVSAVGKLSPIDVKRLSFHMLPHAVAHAQDPKYAVLVNSVEMEERQEIEAKRMSEVSKDTQDDEMKINGECPKVSLEASGEQKMVDVRVSQIPPPPPPLLPPMAGPVSSPPASLPTAPPPPPPPFGASKGNGVAPPPPPPPMGTSKGNGAAVPLPPPPMGASKGNGAAPPPPPGGMSLRPKKAATKLKRSSQMGNLYRVLKGKVEGSSLEGKSSGRKSRIGGGGASGGKQGMADALAEMTKRSAYYQQIEEDCKNYAETVKEVKAAICSFQTSDMTELLKFHKYVESHLEKLTDESQVLARCEEFPFKKLEALRMAAALYSKLDSMVTTLKNWPIVSPSGQLLDKAEGYFNKMKVEIDALERTKDEEAKKFQAQKITFDFGVLLRIKELMVDVSSHCMELALKEKREAISNEEQKAEGKKIGSGKTMWRAFQFAFRVYTFAGGHDDRADKLTRELAHEIETEN